MQIPEKKRSTVGDYVTDSEEEAELVCIQAKYDFENRPEDSVVPAWRLGAAPEPIRIRDPQTREIISGHASEATTPRVEPIEKRKKSTTSPKFPPKKKTLSPKQVENDSSEDESVGKGIERKKKKKIKVGVKSGNSIASSREEMRERAPKAALARLKMAGKKKASSISTMVPTIKKQSSRQKDEIGSGQSRRFQSRVKVEEKEEDSVSEDEVKLNSFFSLFLSSS